MRLKKAAFIGSTLLALGLGATPAFAAPGTAVATPNPPKLYVQTSNGKTNAVPIDFSGWNGTALYVTECKDRPEDNAAWTYDDDCGFLSQMSVSLPGTGHMVWNPNGSQGFVGDEPNNGLFHCAIGETCYLRVTQNSNTNNADAIFIPLGIIDPPPVPEIPWAAVLPLSGAALGGGFLFLQRKRRLTAAA